MVASTQPIATQGINALLAGTCRIPVLIGSAKAAVLFGTVALRGCKSILGYTGWTGPNIFEKISSSEWMPKYFRVKVQNTSSEATLPAQTEEHSTYDMFVAGVALAALTIVGNAAVSYLFGPAPKIYNEVLSWVGPIRISNETYPGFEYIAQVLKK